MGALLAGARAERCLGDIARRYRADYAIGWLYGQSCAVPYTEISKVGFPIKKYIGSLWCGTEDDVSPAGALAKGTVTANYHGVGKDFPVIREITDGVQDRQGHHEAARIGTVAYNRGVITGDHHGGSDAQRDQGARRAAGWQEGP